MATATPPALQFDESLELLFEQLQQIDGKAEIVDGRIVLMSPTQPWPSEVAAEIYVSLRSYVKSRRVGRAVTDGATFRVDLPNRKSFSPDAALHTGKRLPLGYYEGAPVFAVEVRSAGDYGARAERLLAEKRADYFAAGTQVVWDVDLLSRDVIRAYRAGVTDPVVFRADDVAQAEPAVPGWTVSVRELLPDDWELPNENPR